MLDCLSDHAEGGHYSHMGLTEALQTVEVRHIHTQEKRQGLDVIEKVCKG